MVTSQLFPSNKKAATRQNAWNPVEYFWVKMLKIDQYSPHRNPKRAAKFPFPLFQTWIKSLEVGQFDSIPSHRCKSYGILGVNRLTCKALLATSAPCKTRLPEDGAFQLQPHIVTGAHLATWGTMRAGTLPIVFGWGHKKRPEFGLGHLKKSASWFEMRLSKWCFLFSCFFNDVRPFFPKGPVKWTFVESCQVFLSSWTSAESTRNLISWNKCAQSWACHLIFVYFEGVFGGESSQTSSKKRFVANAGIVLEGECAEFGRPGLTFRCWCFKTSHLVLEEHFPEQCLRWRRFEVSLSWQFETTLKQDLMLWTFFC